MRTGALHSHAGFFSLARLAVCVSLAFICSPALRAFGTETAPGPVAQRLETVNDPDLSDLLIHPVIPWGADPFRKIPGFAKVAEKQHAYSLGGIVYNQAEPMAIINEEAVTIGDKIGDREVVSIGENYVILKKEDSLLELVLPPVAIGAEPEKGDDE